MRVGRSLKARVKTNPKPPTVGPRGGAGDSGAAAPFTDYLHDLMRHVFVHPDTGVTITCEHMPPELLPHTSQDAP